MHGLSPNDLDFNQIKWRSKRISAEAIPYLFSQDRPSEIEFLSGVAADSIFVFRASRQLTCCLSSIKAELSKLRPLIGFVLPRL